MAEKEGVKERLRQEEMDPKLYYDYEGRFIKQKMEREQMNILPRVIKPQMFAKGGFVLGDIRVFERYTVAPLSVLSCSFLDIKPGERTELQRMIPSQIAYILEGSGEYILEGEGYKFSAEDVLLVPPYMTYQFAADGKTGFRAWVPQVRLWHVLGLLWQEQFEFKNVPEGTEPLRDDKGQLVGFRVPQGVMNLQQDLEVRAGADPKREKAFRTRREIRQTPAGKTKYDWFLRRMVEENDLEKKSPRIIRGKERPWEQTRQGRLKFYISNWSEVAARALALMVQEIEPGGHSGKHRHLFEELLLVEEGHGYDLHEETRFPWESGDLICIPPMTSHQHFNDGKKVTRLVSVWPRQYAHEFLGGIEQMSDASNWKA